MIKTLLILFFLLALSAPAQALRCGTKIVRNGDHQAKILNMCGEPAAIHSHNIYRSGFPATQITTRERGVRHEDELIVHNRSVVEVVVEEWTYNFGPRRLMRVIRFENGIVTSVKRLGYGYRD